MGFSCGKEGSDDFQAFYMLELKPEVPYLHLYETTLLNVCFYLSYNAHYMLGYYTRTI